MNPVTVNFRILLSWDRETEKNMNPADALVIALVAVIVFLAFRSIRKRGGKSCSCGCSSCSMDCGVKTKPKKEKM